MRKIGFTLAWRAGQLIFGGFLIAGVAWPLVLALAHVIN